MSSSSSISTLLAYRRRRFDDRSQTQTSLLRRAREPPQNQSPLFPLKSASPAPEGDTFLKGAHNAGFLPTAAPLDAQELAPGPQIVHWAAAGGVDKIMRSARFSAHFGTPCCLQLSPSHILVGFRRGAVACFNYHQKLVHVFEVLDPTGAEIGPALSFSPVTCICVSSDGRLAAAGNADGSITIWAFPGQASGSVEPRHVIHPPCKIGVASLAFVGDSHDIVSSDMERSVYFHHGVSKFFKIYYTSEKVHECEEHVRYRKETKKVQAEPVRDGRNAQGQDIQEAQFPEDVCLLDQVDLEEARGSNRILDCLLLPLGTSAQLTDQLGLVAVISCNSLTVLSVRSLNNSASTFPKVHFQAPRPRNVGATSSLSGRLAWYPCVQRNGKPTTAKLAYSWNNVVSVLELDFSALAPNLALIIGDMKDKDRGIPALTLQRTSRHLFPEFQTVSAMKWLNSEILTCVVNEEMCFFQAPELSLVASERFPFAVKDLASKFQILRHRPVVLVDVQTALYTGKPLKWADHLVSLLSENRLADALRCAYDYYRSDEKGKLVLCGLPHTLAERQSVVEPFLIKIMREAAPALGSLDDEVGLILRVVSEIAGNRDGVLGTDLLEIVEIVHENAQSEAFFDTLFDFILGKKIPNLSPELFKLLVEYCVANDLGETLTEIVCLLDISTLNIDMTLKLCKEYDLRECSVYIWNQVFHDYLTPFVELMQEEPHLVYSYMSYILLGRKFPTDEFLAEKDEILGRRAICELLFSPKLENAALPLEESPFPCLLFLLKQNSFEMLATLNEFFENPALNTENKKELNRQYIMDALLDTFGVNSLERRDHVQLSIFVARNYHKYYQFIRLADSTVQDTLNFLLQDSDPESRFDRELAVECMLPFYTGDESYLLEQMKRAEFYNGAFRLYVQDRKYANALDVWMQSQSRLGALDIEFSVVANLLANTFSKSGAETARVLAVLSENCTYFFGNFAEEMLFLGRKFCKRIHLLALDCEDSVAFAYLKMLDEEDMEIRLIRGYIRLSCTEAPCMVTELVRRYKAVLCEDEEVLELLKDHFDALAILYLQAGHHHQALEALIDGIKQEKRDGFGNETGSAEGYERLDAEEIAKPTEEETHEYTESVSIGISICLQAPENWTFFIENLVTCPGKMDQAIYRCFRSIIDNDTSKLFTVLSLIMNKAQVSNVRATLQEILTSFYFESEMNVITLAKVNDGIRKSMEVQRRDVLRGWLLQNKSCASCGKILWGPDVPEPFLVGNERAMQDRLAAAVGDPQTKAYEELQMLFFRCGHIYHEKCLRGLGVRSCVLCIS